MSTTASVPANQSLAAYHEERSEIYAGLAQALCNGEPEPDLSSRRGFAGANVHSEVFERLQGLRHRPLFESWKASLPSEVQARLKVLRQLRDLAAACARALVLGDMALASELWDQQGSILRGPEGALLREISCALEDSTTEHMVRAGRALRLVLEDDAALTELAEVATTR